MEATEAGTETDVKALQLKKAPVLITVTDVGKLTIDKLLQLLKAYSGMAFA